ncbi:hypothetical protein N7456_007697 [Penicillium angulare]|uniref:Uncharacterized protein n=1 Tax=Penicillium angulare TaxID=116970 RepID=A0A9W9K8Z9_9EURO|nr:hypothetical protein N7456_007697 [Penicillium angulare]
MATPCEITIDNLNGNWILTSSIGKLASTTEKRVLNGEVRYHSDYIFGTVTSQSCFVQGSSGVENVDLVTPDFEVRTKSLSSDLEKFFRGEVILEDGELFTRFGEFLIEEARSEQRKAQGRGLWVHTFERSIHSGWEAEQIWGFEMINMDRCFTRRVVVTSAEGKHVYARLVYDYNQ